MRAHPLQRLLLLSVLTLLPLLATASPAAAHTELTATQPTDGAAPTDPVDRVELTFSRSVELLGETLSIPGHDGSTTASRSDDGTVVTVLVDPPLGPGSWEVAWKVLASDSHPRRGSFTFDVATSAPASSDGTDDGGDTAAPPTDATPSEPSEAPTDTPAAQSPTDVPPARPAAAPAAGDTEAGGDAPGRGLRIGGAVARIVLYLGLMGAVGLTLFKAGPHRGEQARARRLAAVASLIAAIALAASAVEVALHVAAVSGRGLTGLFDGPTWRAVLRTGLGTALWVRSLGLVLLVVGARRRVLRGLPSGPDALKLTGAALAIGSFQFVGHTASTAPELLVRGADAIHAIAAAVWVGGLLGLALLAGSADRRGRARTAVRFSTAAGIAVVGVAIAGSALAFATMPDVSSVVTTGYGRVLLSKLLLVGALAAIGAHNHYRVIPLLDGPVEQAHVGLHRLRQTVAVEVVLMVAILGMTAVLVSLSPT